MVFVMKKLVLYPALFGMIGGVLKGLCLAVVWILYPQGRDNYVNTALLYISQVLFAMSICMARGAIEHSASLLKTGALIGIVSGVLATSAIVVILYIIGGADLTLFDHAFVNGLFLGGAVGIVCGMGSNDRRALYFVVGFCAGGVASSSLHLSMAIADITAMLVWKLSSSLDLAMLYGKLVVYPLDGITQSVLIWFSGLRPSNWRDFTEI